MDEYHKIDSVYKRDPDTSYKTFLVGQYTNAAFAYLARNLWRWTEKIDGTNVRVMIDKGAIQLGGRHESSQMPIPLVTRLQGMFFPLTEVLLEAFPNGACFYGEGYGGKIQKGGNYRPDPSFILFDIRIGSVWLERENVEEIANKFGIDTVPDLGFGTLGEMIDEVTKGFPSKVGSCTAEGIVARPLVELCTRSGERIITKVKHKDFA